MVLGVAGVAAAFAIAPQFGIVAGAYLALLLLYSFALKHVVIVDVLTIAGGFVLRAIAGAVAVDVPISHWLLVCTTLLALFLALSKRRHELTLLAEGATDHRRILEEYSPYLLDQMIARRDRVHAGRVRGLRDQPRNGRSDWAPTRLGLTIPFVLYGIFRYLYLVHQKRGGGSPAAMLLTDRPASGAVSALWAASVVAAAVLAAGTMNAQSPD